MRNQGRRETGFAVAEFHDAHNIGAPGQRGARISAGDDLGKRRQIRRDLVEALRATGGAAESGDHFIEDEDDAVFRRDLAQIGQELRGEWDLAEACAGRFENDGGDIVALLADRLHECDVVGWADDRAVDHASQYPRRDRGVVESHLVMPAVEVWSESQNDGLPCVSSGNPQRELRRLGSGNGKSDALGAGNQLPDPVRPLQLELMSSAVVDSARDLLPHRFHHLRMAVAQDQSAMAAEVIDIAVVVDVPLAGAFGAGDIDRMGHQIADIVGDPAGKDFASLGVAIPRSGRLANVGFDQL